jgi:2-dehydro-3-deoxygluconokinase
MKVVTLGEIMLRLSTHGSNRFVQVQSFDATFGGGEANVAVSLANYGLESHFATKVPDHEIGQAAVNHLRRFGVSTDAIVRGGDRLGIYFLETGASQRASKVIYDRAHSAVTTLEPEDLDLEGLLYGAQWFHWTGITPALGPSPRKTLVRACEVARAHGVTISCDLNYRRKLWSVEEARATMIPMMEYVDVCIGNEEDAYHCLGLSAGSTDVDRGHLDEAGYRGLAHSLKQTFGFDVVAITLRESVSASKDGWSAMMLDNRECSDVYRSRRFEIDLVDRVGGGDAFAGGLIYGLLTEEDSRSALEFAVAASCLKQTIPGDLNLVTLDEVKRLASGSGSGRVER